jgi:hypothetical protein
MFNVGSIVGSYTIAVVDLARNIAGNILTYLTSCHILSFGHNRGVGRRNEEKNSREQHIEIEALIRR